MFSLASSLGYPVLSDARGQFVYFIRQKAEFFLLKVSFWARRVIMLKLHKQLGFTTTSRNSYTYLGIQVFRLNSCKQQGTISVFQRVPDGRYLPPRRVANL